MLTRSEIEEIRQEAKREAKLLPKLFRLLDLSSEGRWNPSSEKVTGLLARSGNELRGIEDYEGDVFLWPAADADHMKVADVLGIPYDPTTDSAATLTGKTFYIRSLDDWLNRERGRTEPGSFTQQAIHLRGEKSGSEQW